MKFNQIYLEITKECNLKCSFCPSAFIKGQHMDLCNIEEIIRKTSDYTDTYYLHVLGETLLYPKLDELLSLMDKNQKKVKITTNGILLSEYSEIILSHSSVKQVNVSTQAWLKLSDEYQEKLMKNLINFIKKNNNNLTIAIRFWNDKKDVKVQKLNEFVYNSLIEELNIHKGETDIFITNKKTIRVRPYLLISIDNEFVWPSLDLKVNTNDNYCLGGKKQLAILNNGDVVLCCLDYLGHTKIGNIFENTLNEILNDKLYLAFLEKIRKHRSYFELCEKCDYRNKFN